MVLEEGGGRSCRTIAIVMNITQRFRLLVTVVKAAGGFVRSWKFEAHDMHEASECVEHER